MTKSSFISVENEPLVEAEHPELHHYTNWYGLAGILSTGILYATRYDRLNDRTEVEHFKEVLVDALADSFKSILIDKKKTSFAVRHFTHPALHWPHNGHRKDSCRR